MQQQTKQIQQLQQQIAELVQKADKAEKREIELQVQLMTEQSRNKDTAELAKQLQLCEKSKKEANE